MKTADGYVRVSRVAGRSGESFISPDEQRLAIKAWAKSTKTKILEWHEDLDQSGGTLERPGFSAALERCRAGLTGGIVAAKLARRTRSVARAGRYVNEHAHPAIVTQEEFEAANAARTTQPVPPGETTRGRLLLGLARCAGCGRTLKVVRRPRADNTYVAAYYCKNAASLP